MDWHDIFRHRPHISEENAAIEVAKSTDAKMQTVLLPSADRSAEQEANYQAVIAKYAALDKQAKLESDLAAAGGGLILAHAPAGFTAAEQRAKLDAEVAAINSTVSLHAADVPIPSTPNPVQEPHVTFLKKLILMIVSAEHWIVKEFKDVFNSDEAKAIEAGLVAFAKSKFGQLAMDAVELGGATALNNVAARDAAVAKLKTDAMAAGLDVKNLATSDYNWVIETAIKVIKAGINTVSPNP